MTGEIHINSSLANHILKLTLNRYTSYIGTDTQARARLRQRSQTSKRCAVESDGRGVLIRSVLLHRVYAARGLWAAMNREACPRNNRNLTPEKPSTQVSSPELAAAMRDLAVHTPASPTLGVDQGNVAFGRFPF